MAPYYIYHGSPSTLPASPFPLAISSYRRVELNQKFHQLWTKAGSSYGPFHPSHPHGLPSTWCQAAHQQDMESSSVVPAGFDCALMIWLLHTLDWKHVSTSLLECNDVYICPVLPPPLGSFKDHAKRLVSFIWRESSIKTFDTVTLIDILQIWKGIFTATQSFPPQSLAPCRAKVILLKCKPDRATPHPNHSLPSSQSKKQSLDGMRHCTLSTQPHLIVLYFSPCSLATFGNSQVYLYLRAFASAVPLPEMHFAPNICTDSVPIFLLVSTQISPYQAGLLLPFHIN